MKTYVNPEGYHVVSLQTTIGTFQRMYLHRLVAVVFLSGSNVTGTSSVNHRDENKNNNAASNLEWMPLSENIRLAHQSGAIRQQFPKHPVRLEKDNRSMVFETMSKAAFFLGCSIHAIQASKNGHYLVKGWKVISLVPKEVNGNLFSDNDFE